MSARCRATILAGLVVAVLAPPGRAGVRYRTLQRQRPGYYEAKVAYPRLGGDSEVVDLANRELERLAKSTLAEWVQAAEDGLARVGKPTEPYYLDVSPVVSVADTQLVSVYFAVESYEGGAHGAQDFLVLNVGLKAGEPSVLSLDDLFREDVDARAAASKLVIAQAEQDERAAWVRDGEVKELTAEMANRFVITPTCLAFLFPPYELGPYVAGSFVIKVKLTAFGDQLEVDGPIGGLLHD